MMVVPFVMNGLLIDEPNWIESRSHSNYGNPEDVTLFGCYIFLLDTKCHHKTADVTLQHLKKRRSNAMISLFVLSVYGSKLIHFIPPIPDTPPTTSFNVDSLDWFPFVDRSNDPWKNW
jgi:hypothetical protein